MSPNRTRICRNGDPNVTSTYPNLSPRSVDLERATRDGELSRPSGSVATEFREILCHALGLVLFRYKP
jgi:hypothetical protein